MAPLYLERVKAALGERVAVVKLLPDGEQYKTLDVLATIYDALLESRCDRRTTVVALGGGVVGDMSGFAAATYQRGVSFLQLPTTLLAQVDSSVGGKTGVNHPRGKNMIGAFHQPRCVIADTDTLATLPAREFAAGVAEVIKYGLIGDLGFYRWLQAHSAVLMQRDPRILAQAIRRSCENKARVVAADEREEGLRALLLATGLPVQPPSGIDPSRFLELMAADKKVAAGRIRLVLLRALGEAVVSAEFPPEELQALLRDNLRAAAAASSS